MVFLKVNFVTNTTSKWHGKLNEVLTFGKMMGTEEYIFQNKQI